MHRYAHSLKRILVVVILLLAFFGIADASYLAASEISGTPLICNIESLAGCNAVAESPYSHFFGIPLAIYGVIFYSLLFIVAAFELVFFTVLLRRILQGLALFGAIAGVIFTFIQIYLIGALCIYCLVSATVSFLILVCASLIEPVRLRKEPLPPPSLTRLPMPPA